MTYLNVFLQAGGAGSIGSFLPIILIIVVMWLFFLRPQAKKQKEENKFREGVSKGMKVVTTAGIHGKITDVGDTYVMLEVDSGRLKVEKAAISKEMSAQYQPKEEKGSSDKKK